MLRADGGESTLHRELGDRVALLAFIYASCSDVNGCPLASAVFHKLGSRVASRPALADELQLVSLSFDPERDTPAVMRRYGEGFRDPGVAWSFLTTRDEAELAPLLRAYGQSLVREADARGVDVGPIAHVLRVFLIDRERRVRNVYTVSFLHADTLLADVETLLLEERAATNGAPPVASNGAPPVAAEWPAPGDDRRGYERPDYRSRSRALAARRGEPVDLVARLRARRLGLPPLPPSPGNPVTAEKVALGRKLFFDRRLSHNATFSCAMCHIPEQGFTHNELATSVGIEGRTVRRNAPTVLNAAWVEGGFFHDGREPSLENQVWGPLLARNEMGNPSVGAVLSRIASLEDYAGLFEAAFPERGLTIETVGMALASYERTLVAADSPFDRWRYGGDGNALSPQARRGFELFAGRAGCHGCHTVGRQHATFSDGGFHNTGVGFSAATAPAGGVRRVQVAPGEFLDVDASIIASVSEPRPGDLGRYELTGDPADRWRYRTPSLRNVALTAPYMHDGSLTTLAEVVAFYDRGGVPNEGLDPRVRPLGLSERERADLVAFLESLTGDVTPLVADAFAAPIGDPE